MREYGEHRDGKGGENQGSWKEERVTRKDGRSSGAGWGELWEEEKVYKEDD